MRRIGRHERHIGMTELIVALRKGYECAQENSQTRVPQ